MNRTFLFLQIAVLFGENLCFSQNYYYDYDGSGNRTLRTIALSKSTRSSDDTKKTKEYMEKIENLEISLFPNPTSGEITVKLKNLDVATSSAIYLFDNTGRLLESRTELHEENLFDLSGFSRGIYFMRIFAGKHKIEWKIVKE